MCDQTALRAGEVMQQTADRSVKLSSAVEDVAVPRTWSAPSMQAVAVGASLAYPLLRFEGFGRLGGGSD
jgi:hypothetical protein